MSLLLSLYIGATIFGVGVTLIDLLGLLGGHEADHAGSGSHDSGNIDTAGHDPAAHEGMTDHDSLERIEEAHAGGHEPSVAGHDRPAGRNPLLGLLSLLRNLIYFCLGFGPVGLFALATGGNALTALAWSVPVGGVALLGTRALRRLMRRELNSQISSSELLMEHAVVTVSIGAGELGKVRVKLGDLYVDRFARAASPDAAIRVGAAVRITEVTDDCLYVEEE